MTKFTCRGLLVGSLVAAIGCAPEVKKDEPLAQSAATIAIFAPDAAAPCNSVLPFPSDLAKDPVTGRLNIPFCESDSPMQVGIKMGLRSLDGYGLGSTLHTRFSRALDPDSLEGAVMLIDTSTGLPVQISVSFSAQADNTLYILPAAPLKEKTRYVAAVTTAVKDSSGNPIVADQVFTFAKSRTPLVDADGYSRYTALPDDAAYGLEGLRQAFSAMFEALEGGGIPREQIAVAWPFTTQSVNSTVQLLAGFVGILGAPDIFPANVTPAAAHPLLAAAGIPTANLCHVHSGRVRMHSLLTDSGTFGVTASGTLATREINVDYLLTTPKVDSQGQSLDCSEPWSGEKVAVYVHGLGRCKNDALALANDLAAAGFAVLSLDGPRAGTRTVGSLGDQDLDGCVDQPATPEFIALPGASPNPFAIRDHLRQWSLELVQIAAAAKASPRAFVGLSGTGTAKVAAIGHSWGGMAASLAGSARPFDALVVNAASGELGAVFRPALGQAVAGQLLAAGVNLESAEGQAALAQGTEEVVAVFRWAMEPGDPLYAAVAYDAQKPVLVQVVSSGGAAPETPMHGSATQTRLALAFDRAPLEKTTFELGVCDSPSGMVGALLMPCVADTEAASYPLALVTTAGLRRQAVTFLATGAAGQPLVCNPDYTAPCN
jgi:pimeloyl-ACP methyl ester carboxylesterase